MKRKILYPMCYLVFVALMLINNLSAQDYQISFNGIGAAITYDSVMVENITQCTYKKLNQGDILNLTSILGTDNLKYESNNNVIIYPNPMEGNGTIEFFSPTNCITTLELSDMSGKRILYRKEFLSKGYHGYTISGISKGIYLFRVKSEDYSSNSKIVCNSPTTGNTGIKLLELGNASNAFNSLYSTKKTSLKSGETTIHMQYNTNDILKITGVSGKYQTITMLVPTKTQTVTFNFVACTDGSNNNYPVVQIGKQLWMAENLKTTKYRDGTNIPNVSDNTAWSQLTTGAYCYYNNLEDNGKISGKFYNAFAFENAHKLSPEGWHVATDNEWTTLTDTLGGWATAGFKLRENCNTLWQAPNLGATNETGFTAKPGGYRSRQDGIFSAQFTTCYFWTSTEDILTPGTIFSRLIYSYNNNVYKGRSEKTGGYYVRCVKDE